MQLAIRCLWLTIYKSSEQPLSSNGEPHNPQQVALHHVFGHAHSCDYCWCVHNDLPLVIYYALCLTYCSLWIDRATFVEWEGQREQRVLWLSLPLRPSCGRGSRLHCVGTRKAEMGVGSLSCPPPFVLREELVYDSPLLFQSNLQRGRGIIRETLIERERQKDELRHRTYDLLCSIYFLVPLKNHLRLATYSLLLMFQLSGTIHDVAFTVYSLCPIYCL